MFQCVKIIIEPLFAFFQRTLLQSFPPNYYMFTRYAAKARHRWFSNKQHLSPAATIYSNSYSNHTTSNQQHLSTAATIYSNSSIHQTTTSFAALAAVSVATAAAALALASSSPAHCSAAPFDHSTSVPSPGKDHYNDYTTDAASQNPELSDLKRRLGVLLHEVRKVRQTDDCPSVSIELIPTDDGSNVWSLSFQTHKYVDTLSLLSIIVAAFPDKLHFSRITTKTDEESQSKGTLPPPLGTSSRQSSPELSLVFRDDTASFTITQQEVVFYTDNVPSQSDLTGFVEAYAAGTTRASFTHQDEMKAWQDFLLNDVPKMIPIPKVPMLDGQNPFKRDPTPMNRQNNPRNQQQAIEQLQSLGVEVYGVGVGKTEPAITWEVLAGYEKVKSDVEDTVLLALKHPETYERIARSTREVYETNRPKAIIFEGPPGTGKTTTARIIASQAGVPLIYVPVETIVSKWYGESGKNLSKIFDACEAMGDTIIFLDEIDALATKRGSGNMHEATRRTLSVLLRRLEGFKQKRRTIFVCATNRKEDLDPALLSRFDLSVRFDLPDAKARSLIFARYARHLNQEGLSDLSQDIISGGMAGRDIKEVCQAAERRFASRVIRKQGKGSTPPLSIYLDCSKERKGSMNGGSTCAGTGSRGDYYSV